MFRYDPNRSEFAISTRTERIVQVALLTVAVAGALITLAGGANESQRARWMSGAVVTIVSVFFVPNRRWRMAMAVAAIGLMIIAFVAG
jgi:hypothetical protein